MAHQDATGPGTGDIVIKIVHIDNQRRWLIGEWGGMYNADPLDLATAKREGVNQARNRRIDCWLEESDGSYTRLFQFGGETREAAAQRLFRKNEEEYGYAFATLLDRRDKDRVHVIAPLTTGGFSYHQLPASYDFRERLPVGAYQGNPMEWPYELFASLGEATEYRADMMKW